jgi:RNA polymerase sigma-70 factor (ECF subfamily)
VGLAILKLAPKPPPSAAEGGLSDAALCSAFLEGDREAFGVLLSRHRDTVFRITRRFAKSDDEALDLTQRAFLQAFEAARRSLPKLEAAQAGREFPFRAWLLRIAVNLAKNHVRDASRWARSPVEAIDAERSEEPRAQQALERAQAQVQVHQAVADLPKRQREVFALRVDGDLPFAEVAKVLGITETNAKVHFHHAVKALRAAVQAQLQHEERP